MYETNAVRSDYVKFGKAERYVPQVFDKRQKNGKDDPESKKEKEDKNRDKHDETEFVDRSFCLDASLHSLALINSVKFGGKARDHINAFVEDKLTKLSDDTNPFCGTL